MAAAEQPRPAPGQDGEHRQHQQDRQQGGQKQQGGYPVGIKIRDVFPVGDKVHRARLIAVQPDGGGAHHLALGHGGPDALGQVEGKGHLVVGVAVAVHRVGGVQLHLRLGPALGQGHRGQRGLGVHQLPVVEGGEHPVQHLGALAVDVVQVRPQHHQAVGVALALGKRDEAAARQGGEAGLHPPDVVPVICVLRVDHQVGGADLPLGRVEVGGRQGVGDGLGDLHVPGLGVAGRRDLGQIPGGGHVAVIVQPVHAAEGGVGAAQFGGPLVHLGHKSGQVPRRHIAGHRTGGIVGAGHDHPVQQVDPAHRLPDPQAHGAAVGVLDVGKLLGQAGGHRDGLLQVQAALQIEQGGHHLGQAGDVAGLVGVLLQDGLAGVQVEQIDRFFRICGRDRHGIGRQPRQGQTDGQRQHTGQRSGPAQHRAEKMIHNLASFGAAQTRASGF